jgi:hypothetical protein
MSELGVRRAKAALSSGCKPQTVSDLCLQGTAGRIHAGLIDDLGTLTRNSMRVPLAAKHPVTLLSKSTPLQEATFKLLSFNPKRVQ